MDINNLIFLPLNIPNPPSYADFWNTIPYSEMIKDTYRNCFHIPIHIAKEGYTRFANQTPDLCKWIDEYIFSFTDLTRVMIITTPPGDSNPVHIDCSPSKFKTLQHKIRYVFQGKVSSLEFITESKNIKPSDIDSCFVMDGSWPHTMHNDTHLRKYTLAIGFPWEPSLDDDNYINLLKDSYKKFKNNYIELDKTNLPFNYKEFFEKKYEKELELLK